MLKHGDLMDRFKRWVSAMEPQFLLPLQESSADDSLGVEAFVDFYRELKKRKVLPVKNHQFDALFVQNWMKKFITRDRKREALEAYVACAFYVNKWSVQRIALLLKSSQNQVRSLARDAFKNLYPVSHSISREELKAELLISDYFEESSDANTLYVKKYLAKSPHFKKRLQGFNKALEEKRAFLHSDNVLQVLRDKKSRFVHYVEKRSYIPWVGPVISIKEIILQVLLVAMAVLAVVSLPSIADLKNIHFSSFWMKIEKLPQKYAPVLAKVKSLWGHNSADLEDELLREQEKMVQELGNNDILIDLFSDNPLSVSQEIEKLVKEWAPESLKRLHENEKLAEDFKLQFELQEERLGEVKTAFKMKSFAFEVRDLRVQKNEDKTAFIKVLIRIQEKELPLLESEKD